MAPDDTLSAAESAVDLHFSKDRKFSFSVNKQ